MKQIDPEKFDDVDLLVNTWPWWKRALAWCFWKTPSRFVLRRWFVNPYGAVVGVMRVNSSHVSHYAKK